MPLGSLDYTLDETPLAGKGAGRRALPACCQELPLRQTKDRLNSAARQVAPGRGRPIVAVGAFALPLPALFCPMRSVSLRRHGRSLPTPNKTPPRSNAATRGEIE